MPQRQEPTGAPELSPRVEQAIHDWLEALLWQRRVDRALRPLGLTHTQFLVLHAATVITGRGTRGVSKVEVAEVARLDRSTTSALLFKLQDQGFVDCGPHGLDMRKFSVLVTRKGHFCLEDASAVVEGIAREFDRGGGERT